MDAPTLLRALTGITMASVLNMKNNGHAFWLFGLSGAGKTTLSSALKNELSLGPVSKPLMLDGDQLRLGLCHGLGFTVEDREENLRRAAEVTRLGVECGLVVIAAFITPCEEHRNMIRRIVGEERLSLVYLSATVEECRARDTKGLYAAAAAGTIQRLSGVDSTFDEPNRFDLRLDTGTTTVASCVATLVSFYQRRLCQ